MSQVLLEVGEVFLHQPWFALDDEQVLCVLLLCRLREVERPGNDRLLIDDHDLVMRDGVPVVDVSRDANVVHEVRGTVLC